MSSPESDKLITRLGEKLLTLRQRHGWTQREMAKKLNSSHVSLGDIERGKVLPSVTKLLRIAILFNVSLDVLLRDELELD